MLTVRLAPQLSVPVTVPQFLASRAQKAVSLSGVQAGAGGEANQSRFTAVSAPPAHLPGAGRQAMPGR